MEGDVGFLKKTRTGGHHPWAGNSTDMLVKKLVTTVFDMTKTLGKSEVRIQSKKL